MFAKKRRKKKTRSERSEPVTSRFRVYRICLSFCKLDKRRDSSFFYSRNAGFQHYRWICAGTGFLRICAGTRFRFFRGTRDTGLHFSRDRGYGISHCARGHGISHFARDHGIIPNPVQSRGKNPGEGPVFFGLYDVVQAELNGFCKRRKLTPF